MLFEASIWFDFFGRFIFPKTRNIPNKTKKLYLWNIVGGLNSRLDNGKVGPNKLNLKKFLSCRFQIKKHQQY